MSRAVCARCGTFRKDYREPCAACGLRAEGDGLLVAWLLSDLGLGDAALDDAAARIRRGEPLQPSSRLLAKARAALGGTTEADPGLSSRERFGILFCAVFLTALPGLVFALHSRRTRPRAALQAVALSLPFAAAWTLFLWWEGQ